MSQIFGNLIYHLDLFKSPIYLLFNSKIKVPSKFSCFFSICISCFLITFFFQSDLIAKKRPTSSIQSIVSSTRPRLDFNYENMAFAFGLTDSQNRFQYDPTFFKFDLRSQTVSSTGEMLEENIIELKPCNESDFKTHGNAYQELGLNQALCPERGNFTLEGYWNEKVTKYFYIWVTLCKNDTTNGGCKSQEVIHSFFQEKYFSIFYSDSIIDVNNYEKPLQNTYKTSFFLLDSIISKKMTINFKKGNFLNDDGIILENEISQEFFMFGNIEMDYLSGNEQYLGNIVLHSSSEICFITRRYQKLQEAIANLGGLANALLLIGYVFTFLEKEFIVFYMLMNRLYTFSENKQNLTASKTFNTLQDYIKDTENNENNKKPELNSSIYQSKLEKNNIKDLNSNDEASIRRIERYVEKNQTSPKSKPKQDKNERKSEFNSIKMSQSIIHSNMDKSVQKNFKIINFIKPKTLSIDTFCLEHYSDESIKGKQPEKAKISTKIKKSSTNLKNVFGLKLKKFINSQKNDSKEENNLNFLEFIKIKYPLPFIKLTRKEKLYKEAINKYHEEMDVVNIIQKIHDIDKLKIILFNPEQCQLFNLLAKPIISTKFNKNNVRNSLSTNMKMTLNLESLKENLNVDKLENYYLKMKNEGKKASEIDQRLINMLEKNII